MADTPRTATPQHDPVDVQLKTPQVKTPQVTKVEAPHKDTPGVGTNVGPEPAEAKPNHVREKTYKAPETPRRMTEALENLPEKTAEDNVRADMHEAVDKVKRHLP